MSLKIRYSLAKYKSTYVYYGYRENEEVEINEGATDEINEEEDIPQGNPYRNVKWLKKQFPSRKLEDDIRRYQDSPENIVDGFLEYLNMEFWEWSANATNCYAFQERNHRPLDTSAEELLHLTGMHILMGCIGFPQLNMYWSNDFRIPKIANCMSRQRFSELRRFIRFVDPGDITDKSDRLWKVRPFVDAICNQCRTLPRSYHMAIDEQMIPFSGRCGIRQYMPAKPNPLGLKNYVLAASDGLVLGFHIYTGKGSVSNQDMKEYGLGASIVKLLTSSLTEEARIYTNRFFTSVKCIELMKNRNIFHTGTVMKNRIGPIVIKLKEDRMMERGEWEEWVREDDKMAIVKWKDNKGVMLLSSYVGGYPQNNCQRWSKKQKRRTSLPQPAIVAVYNRYMGGVDLCDRYIALYRCYVRTFKWTLRAFNHFVDLIVVNLWIMHNRRKPDDPKEKKITVLDFKIYVGKALPNYSSKAKDAENHACSNRTGDPATVDTELTSSLKRRKVSMPLLREERYDAYSHLPKFIDAKNASKCRNPQCSSRTRTMCTKCNLYLCTNSNNCFLSYHKKIN